MPTQLITVPNIIIKVLYFFMKCSLKRHNARILHKNRVHLIQTNNWIEQTLAGNKLQSNNNGSKERYKITRKKKLNNTRENYKANIWLLFTFLLLINDKNLHCHD